MKTDHEALFRRFVGAIQDERSRVKAREDPERTPPSRARFRVSRARGWRALGAFMSRRGELDGGSKSQRDARAVLVGASPTFDVDITTMCRHDLTDEREGETLRMKRPAAPLEKVRQLFVRDPGTVVLDGDRDDVGRAVVVLDVNEHAAGPSGLSTTPLALHVAQSVPHERRDAPRELLTVDKDRPAHTERYHAELDAVVCGLLRERAEARTQELGEIRLLEPHRNRGMHRGAAGLEHDQRESRRACGICQRRWFVFGKSLDAATYAATMDSQDTRGPPREAARLPRRNRPFASGRAEPSRPWRK